MKRIFVVTLAITAASTVSDALAQSNYPEKPVGNSPEAFAAIIKADIPKWAKVIKDSGAKQD